VVLLCGLAFAVLIAIFEFCYNSRRNAPAERVSTSIPQFKAETNRQHVYRMHVYCIHPCQNLNFR